ncbi:MAG: hypothetical protein ACI9FR_001115 [Cryomorphaceae bacterium]|jgi:hypothetical protein
MMLGKAQRKNPLVALRLSSALVCITLLSACVSTVTVTGEVPEPLVKRLPIDAKMSYTDAFKEYKYTEAEKGRSLKSLDFSAAQIHMFDTVFGRLLNLVQGEDQLPDLTIEPEILDFQYTAPRETNLKLYEVWLKYRLKLIGRDDKELADWTIKGYGKTPTASFTSASTAFNSATNVALRDVGAQLSIRLPKQSSIKGLLDPVQSDADAQEAADVGAESTQTVAELGDDLAQQADVLNDNASEEDNTQANQGDDVAEPMEQSDEQ